MNKTILYSHEDFDRDMDILVEQLDGKVFDLIVGINRGGCLPAVCLSHALKIPCTMIDFSTRDGVNIHPVSIYGYFEGLTDHYDNILIVDDLIDSGVAMKKILSVATCFTRPTVATLLHNTDVDLGVEHYYGTAYSRKTELRYFDFWWEMYGKEN